MAGSMTLQGIAAKNTAMEKRLDAAEASALEKPSQSAVSNAVPRSKLYGFLMVLMIFGAFATHVGITIVCFNMAKESHVAGAVMTTSDGHTPVATSKLVRTEGLNAIISSFSVEDLPALIGSAVTSKVTGPEGSFTRVDMVVGVERKPDKTTLLKFANGEVLEINAGGKRRLGNDFALMDNNVTIAHLKNLVIDKPAPITTKL